MNKKIKIYFYIRLKSNDVCISRFFRIIKISYKFLRKVLKKRGKTRRKLKK